MASILLLSSYENGQPYGDRTGQVFGTMYQANQYFFNTVTRQVEVVFNGTYDDFQDANHPEAFSFEGEFYHRCEGTTRQGYVHDGHGGFTIDEIPNSGECVLFVLDYARATDADASGFGTLTIQASGGTAPLTASAVELLTVALNQSLPAQSGQPTTFPGVPPGLYAVRVTDSTSPFPLVVEAKLRIAAYVAKVNGCTDPKALNYDAGATYENGSCQYTPPVEAPFFAVPQLQTLRFVLPVLPDGCSTFENLDNVLFCEQARPGQRRRPYFFQLVQRCDRVRVQVLTNYAAVTARISVHGGALLSETPLTKVLALQGDSNPLAVTLSASPTGTTLLTATAGGALPASLLAAQRVVLSSGGTYLVTKATPGTALATADALTLNRPWQAPAGAVTVTWQLSGPGFNVWEADLPLAGLPDNCYQVELRATRSGWPVVAAISEPLQLQDTHRDTVVVEWRNADNCYGTVFTTGLTPRLRVRGTFFRERFGGTENTYRGSNNQQVMLASTAQLLMPLEVVGAPAWVHRKLYLACRLDYLRVNGVQYTQNTPYDMADDRDFPLKAGSALLEQIDALGLGNGDDAGVDTSGPDNALVLRQGGYLLLRRK